MRIILENGVRLSLGDAVQVALNCLVENLADKFINDYIDDIVQSPGFNPENSDLTKAGYNYSSPFWTLLENRMDQDANLNHTKYTEEKLDSCRFLISQNLLAFILDLSLIHI